MNRVSLATLATAAAVFAACGDSRAARAPSVAGASAVAVGAAGRPDSVSTLPAGYALTDTADFTGMTNDGRRAILRAPDGTALDTVDLGFGVHTVGRDSLLLLPVRAEDLGGGQMGAGITEHELLHAGRRRALKTLLPHFSDYFSSPAVIDRALFYWGLEPDPASRAGHYQLWAVRYDFPTARRDSLALGSVTMETDDRGYLTAPFREGPEVIYRMGEVRWSWRPPPTGR